MTKHLGHSSPVMTGSAHHQLREGMQSDPAEKTADVLGEPRRTGQDDSRKLSPPQGMMSDVDVKTLDLAVYSEADAAEILRVPASTLHWWLEGRKSGATVYPPVLRPEPTGSRSLTWAEFVEAALLRQYRRQLRVDLQEIRTFIARLRDEQGVPYPLAHYRPWVGEGRRLLLDLQKSSALPGELWLVAPANDQVVLTEPAASFLKRVEWSDDIPVAWRPHDDDLSPVRCLPTQRFGRPSVHGISTEVIVEHLDGGEDEQEVAEQFDLDVDDVRWARSYELSRSTPVAA